MLSRFLSEDFDVTQALGVVAGQGRYPALLVEQLRAAGITVRLIAFEDETDPALVDTFSAKERAHIKVGQVGHMLKAMQSLELGYAIMAGQITPKKLFRGLHPDLKAVRLLAGLKARNAETIFGALVTEVERIGVRLLDARAFLDAHLATPGQMTKATFTDADALNQGVRLANACAELAIGQGVVVSEGTTLAVEAFEGTDAMLRRAGSFGAKAMLYVKTLKPGQDTRFDVPVFGMQTVEVMREAGIGAAALKTGDVLMLDKPDVIALADRYRIALLGF